MSPAPIRGAMLVAAAAAAAGCSGLSSSPVAPQTGAPSSTQSRGVVQLHAKTALWPYITRTVHTLPPRAPNPVVRTPDYPTNEKLLFVADIGTATVQIYKIGTQLKNGAPIAAISSGLEEPYGVAADVKTGEVYVADLAQGVFYYKKGQTTSAGEITNGVSEPTGVAVSPSGEIWVSNLGAGDITVYKTPTSSPTTVTGVECPIGSAFDKKGNFYVADICQSQVFEVKKGSTTASSLGLSGIEDPFGVAFDRDGNLWVSDPEVNEAVVYAAGSTTPSYTVGGFEEAYIDGSDKAGNVLVGDIEGSTVSKFIPGASSPESVLTNTVSEPTASSGT